MADIVAGRTAGVTADVTESVTLTSQHEIDVRVRPVRVVDQVGLEDGAVRRLVLGHDVTVFVEELLHQLDDLVPKKKMQR